MPSSGRRYADSGRRSCSRVANQPSRNAPATLTSSVAHGQRPNLRPGFAGLYRALGLPVVPVAHDSGRLWTRGLVKRPGTIRVRVGEVIPAGLKRDEIEARVQAAINALN